MNIFYKGGRGMPCGQSDKVTQLHSDTPSSPNLKYIGVILFFCLFNVAAIGQSRTPSPSEAATEVVQIKPLEIGDTIPEELWHMPLHVVNHPAGKDTITLNDYRDKKLIILDFWATWCSSCIKNFSKLRELKEKYTDQVEILLVTYEQQEAINDFFESEVGKPYTDILSVVADKGLANTFPHRALPHVVWINKEATVLNITDALAVTQLNIAEILNKGQAKMATKIDIDRERPLFLSESFDSSITLHSYSLFAEGYYAGLPSGNRFKRDKNGKIHGRQLTNISINRLYSVIADELFKERGHAFNTKRLVSQHNDETNEEKMLYHYEFIIPHDHSDSLYHFMLNDLNRNSGHRGEIRSLPVQCFIMTQKGNKRKLKTTSDSPSLKHTRNSITMRNKPVSDLLVVLNDIVDTDLPVLDETGITENIDMDLTNISDINKLRDALSAYGLDLVQDEREIDMFLVSINDCEQ